MSNNYSPALQPVATSFNDLFQYKPYVAQGGLYSVYPQVIYNDIVYMYTSAATPVSPATNPVTYVTPDLDSSAIALYTLGGGTPTEVLSTPYTGLLPTYGVPTASSSILQAMNNVVSFMGSPADVNAINMLNATVSAGALNLGTINSTSNITSSATSVTLPANYRFNGALALEITSGATSGATFTVTATNATVRSTPLVFGASLTDNFVSANMSIVTTGVSVVTIVVSALTGTVATSGRSYLQLTGFPYYS